MSPHTLELTRQAELRLRAQSLLTGHAVAHHPADGASAALGVLHGLASSHDTAADALALLHELQVHQVEIDLQAQELNTARLELEAALARLTQRHDHAPVSCLTVDAHGRLTEINETGARRLQSSPQALIGQAFDHFLCGTSATDWCAWLQRLDAAGQGAHTTVTGELTLTAANSGAPQQVHASVTRDPAGPLYLIALMDQ